MGRPPNTVGAPVGRDNKSQVKAKVFTLDGLPLDDEVKVVQGTIRIFSHPAKVLIDQELHIHL